MSLTTGHTGGLGAPSAAAVATGPVTDHWPPCCASRERMIYLGYLDEIGAHDMGKYILPDAAYDAGQRALNSYPLVVGDRLSVAKDAITAAAPIILTTKLTEIVNRLQELPESIRDEDGRSIRSSPIGLAVWALATGIICEEIESLKSD